MKPRTWRRPLTWTTLGRRRGSLDRNGQEAPKWGFPGAAWAAHGMEAGSEKTIPRFGTGTIEKRQAQVRSWSTSHDTACKTSIWRDSPPDHQEGSHWGRAFHWDAA